MFLLQLGLRLPDLPLVPRAGSAEDGGGPGGSVEVKATGIAGGTTTACIHHIEGLSETVEIHAGAHPTRVSTRHHAPSPPTVMRHGNARPGRRWADSLGKASGQVQVHHGGSRTMHVRFAPFPSRAGNSEWAPGRVGGEHPSY